MKSGATSSRYATDPALQRSQSPVRLRLLGLPRVFFDTYEFPLAATRPMQLLVYLAVRGSWQSRQDVAQLFWPDRGNKIAHSNLRNLLVRTFAAAPYAPIESTEHALRFSAPCDLRDFTAAVHRSDAEASVQIGADDLLLGFDSRVTEPWQRWLERERETLQTQWIGAVQILLAQASRPILQRAELAEAWARRCPYDEDAVHVRMLIAKERGQSGAVTSVYRAFAALLRAEFGVNPSRDLERFALEEAQSSRPPSPHSVTHAPSKSNPLELQSARSSNDRQSAMVGRRLELRQLKALLANASVRLITLTGTGGVGKSTLIAELYAQCADDDAAHTVLVDARAARNAQAVIGAIAAALGLEGLQGENNVVALADTLRDRRYMLMIDGAEQPDLAAAVALLLDRCPNTRLLIASRSTLQLDREQVQVLDGFPLPDADETDTDVLGSNDGVRYFAAVMSHAGQPVDLTHNAGSIAALVHAVEGLPLALKLLAKLTRMFSLPQLLDSIRNQMAGAVGQNSPGLGGLMPALIASFDRSWTALSPVEQTVLSRLAVFPAGFDVAAACAVAGTQLAVITSLIDRSLVRPNGAGRVSLHAGIRACVLAVCPPTENAVAAYVEHYTQRAAALADIARVKSVRPLQQFVSDEEVHVQHAWQLAVARRAYATLLSLAGALTQVIGAAKSVGEWFLRVIQSLLNDQNLPLALRAFLLAEAARDAWNQGKIDLAMDQVRQALRAAQQSRYRAATRSALVILARAYMVQHKMRQAEAVIRRLVAMCNQADGADSSQSLLDVQTMFGFITGNYEQALFLSDLLIANYRHRDDSNAMVHALRNKWTVCHLSGDQPQARQLMDQLIDEANASDVSRTFEASVLADAAQWHYDLGRFAQSRACVERANALALICPQNPGVALKIQVVVAALGIDAADLESAAQQLNHVLATLSCGEQPAFANEAFMATARWFRLAGDLGACVDALRAIRMHPFFHEKAFDQAQALLRELGEAPPPRTDVVPGDPEVGVAEAARVARQRLLSLLDVMQRGTCD